MRKVNCALTGPVNALLTITTAAMHMHKLREQIVSTYLHTKLHLDSPHALCSCYFVMPAALRETSLNRGHICAPCLRCCFLFRDEVGTGVTAATTAAPAVAAALALAASRCDRIQPELTSYAFMTSPSNSS
jgi:hypothetical protein